MDGLFHNPVAEMYGPTFLMVYGAVIAVTLILCYYAARRGTSAESGPPEVPMHPDQYDM